MRESLAPGTRLGRYDIVGFMDAGGMGEVYRAHDGELGRPVAIKILPAAFADHPDRLRRFELEARATAALNHPNILAVYDVGRYDGTPYIVSELLEGQTLRARLDGAALPLRTAIEFGIQIAEGLAAAHHKGIVHRDLKPENIFVTSDERLKILDFGLAKLVELDSVTLTASPQTAAGMVLGTVGYLSPEQASGVPADHRSDIFSVGAVLFEMVTHRRAFARATAAQTLTAVLEDDPTASIAIGAGPSARVMNLVRRCLDKSPERRLQSARDLALMLSNELTGVSLSDERGASAQALGSLFARWSPFAWLALLLLIGVGSGSAFYLSRADGTQPSEVRLQLPVVDAGGGPARVVVLPFENLTRQASDDWLAGAFSDALTAGLQPVLDIVLVPRERVVELYAAEFRQESQSLSSDLARQISEKLRVRYYVHGGYQRVGDNLRVAARLVDAEKGTIEAQETLTDRIANVFTLEDELGARFASHLGGRVARTMTPAETPPLEAYRAVIDARADYALGQLDEARVLLRRAVDLAPRYALAWAWLSKTNARIAAPANFGGKEARIELLRQALAEASTAVSLQPGLVDGEIALALVYRGLVQPTAQRAAAERAVALDPHSGEALGLIAESNAISASFGCPRDPRPELAEQQYRNALRIDPLHGNVRLSLTTHLWWMNRPTEAFAVSDEGISMVPNSAVLNTWRPFNMAFAGRTDEAFALWRTNTRGVSELKPIDAFIAAIIELKRRNFATADDYFKRAGSQADTLPFPLIAAVAHFQVGRMTEGTAFLQRGLQASAECVAWFDRVPAFAPFKDHSAVRKLLDRARQTGPVG